MASARFTPPNFMAYKMVGAVLIIGALALTACASHEPVAFVPPDLVRPACHPPAGLMVSPQPLPAIRAGQRMTDALADDAASYNALRRAMVALQKHITEWCQ